MITIFDTCPVATCQLQPTSGSPFIGSETGDKIAGFSSGEASFIDSTLRFYGHNAASVRYVDSRRLDRRDPYTAFFESTMRPAETQLIFCLAAKPGAF
jgi:hypothetical protein